jgi:hypothetical protein
MSPIRQRSVLLRSHTEGKNARKNRLFYPRGHRLQTIFLWTGPKGWTWFCYEETQVWRITAFKGIVSRDLHIGFWYHLTLLPLTEWVNLLLKFRFRVEFFDFRVSAWSWAIGLSAASFVAPWIPLWVSCKWCFGGKLLKMNTVPCSPGLLQLRTTIRSSY